LFKFESASWRTNPKQNRKSLSDKLKELKDLKIDNWKLKITLWSWPLP